MDELPIYKRQFDNEPNWQEAEDALFAACGEAIERLQREQPDATVSFFAFDSEPSAGYALISIDTPENEQKNAIKEQEYEVALRLKKFSGEKAWESTEYYIQQRQPKTHSHSTGAMEFAQWESVELESWEEFLQEIEEEELFQRHDYLMGHARLIFWRVFERLIVENAFASLKLASPFRLGYNFHDESLVVVRILNWPSPGN